MLYFVLSLSGTFLSAVLLFIYWKLIRTSKSIYVKFRNQGVPGEPFVPIMGQMLELYRASQKDSLVEWMEHLVQKHGYYFLIGFGPLTRLFVIEPNMIGDILHRSHADDYMKPADLIAIFEPLIGIHNLVVTEGAEHDRTRKMINPAFYFNNLKALIPIFVQQTNKIIDEIFAMSNNQQTIDLQNEFSKLTLSIIVSSAFGKQFEIQDKLKKIVCETLPKVISAVEYRSMRMINQIPLLAKLPICQKDVIDQGSEDIARIVNQIIADRREGHSKSLSSNSDLLDLLLSAVDSDDIPFNDQEIKENALTFVLAGHETTGNLMTWVSYILMTNNNVLRTCQEEVDKILPNGIQITYEHLAHLHVCEAVIQETLRLYPSASFLARECIREHTIGNANDHQLTIPAKATVIIDIYQLHRRAEFWERPLEFDYTRWLRDPITGLKPKLPHPYCYIPFSAGARNCIGQNFALLEAKVILASLVQRCNLELEVGQKIVPDIMLNMRSKYGLRAKVTQR